MDKNITLLSNGDCYAIYDGTGKLKSFGQRDRDLTFILRDLGMTVTNGELPPTDGEPPKAQL